MLKKSGALQSQPTDCVSPQGTYFTNSTRRRNHIHNRQHSASVPLTPLPLPPFFLHTLLTAREHSSSSSIIHLIPPHSTSLHLTPPHSTSFPLIPPHSTSFHLIPPHSTSLHLTSPHSTSLHLTPPHSTSLHLIPRHRCDLAFSLQPTSQDADWSKIGDGSVTVIVHDGPPASEPPFKLDISKGEPLHQNSYPSP